MPRRRTWTPWRHGPMRESLSAIEAALKGDDIVERIRASQELVRLGDIHEERVVLAARARGWSWETIASYMGCSTQAVHKRWRRRLEGDRYDPRSWRRKPQP